MNVAINISYCAEHKKGVGPPIDPAIHSQWLYECIGWWHNIGFSAIIVSMTGFHGLMHVPAGPERDYLWKVWNVAQIVSMPDNPFPGNQVGAGWGIRQGLEACGKTGIDYMVHTAEDVIPYSAREVNNLLYQLAECNYDYAGEQWGHNAEFLNAQFFACRVQSLVPDFNPCCLSGDNHTEKYLQSMMNGKRIWTGPRCYWHSHDYNEWRTFLNR